MLLNRFFVRLMLPTVLIIASFLAVLGFNQAGNQTQPGNTSDITEQLNELCLDIYSRTARAIVSVKSPVTILDSSTGTGSGFIINEKGYILTAFENIKDAKIAIITSFGGLTSKMEVTEVNAAHGWALLKPVPKVSKQDYLTFDVSSEYQIADALFVVSDAVNSLVFSGKPTISFGELTGIYEKTAAGEKSLQEFIETSCKVGDGSIGAPLINIDGKVIGIIQSHRKAGRWLATAIPARTFHSDLIKSIE